MRSSRRETEVRETLEGQPVGASLRLAGIEGGRRRRMQLLGLGVRIGSELVVTHARGRGVVVAADSGRIAIGPEMARHLHVEHIDR